MKIALIGDIGLFRGNSGASLINAESKFKTVINILNDHDYVIGNLETPLTNSSRVIGGKSAYIKGLPSDINFLKKLGITHVSLANNHMYDFRSTGLNETIKLLELENIKWFGINGKSELIDENNTKVAIHGYCCYSTHAKGMDQKNLFINKLDPLKMKADLLKDRDNGYLSILSCHWGEEHVHYPNYNHINLARTIAQYNDDIIIHGHHPHVIQGIENIGRSIIAYSLGNFCFDDVYTDKSDKPLVKLSKDNKETYILSITIKEHHVVKYDVIPVSFCDGSYNIEPSILEKISLWSKGLNENMDIYIERRTKQINEYLNNRKINRDLQWYIKRLNFESAKMILGSHKCRKRYNDMVKRIKDLV